MLCPNCLSNTRVIKTLKNAHENVERYRKCPSCGAGYITREKIVYNSQSEAFFLAQKEMTYKYSQEDLKECQGAIK